MFSGSELGKLEETFGSLPVWLAAENGVYVRPPKDRDLPEVGRFCFLLGGTFILYRVCIGSVKRVIHQTMRATQGSPLIYGKQTCNTCNRPTTEHQAAYNQP